MSVRKEENGFAFLIASRRPETGSGCSRGNSWAGYSRTAGEAELIHLRVTEVAYSPLPLWIGGQRPALLKKAMRLAQWMSLRNERMSLVYL